ncbi:hypothetical protein [Pseudobutyrivibrio xylanivorans]|uniref:Glucosyl transferase GtrII n=1 Tax=Pseudobutyrivibrio xylanivorans TaxID=185007 RepID=A0A1G5RWY8_PSEXY|nr:hypothetical protein [Pseudobutyrivibrio xylanivorans]SCZ78632.1 hypothetical protein SAMN02910350_01369 [Pseudobutyrivibrio xylanivorans]
MGKGLFWRKEHKESKYVVNMLILIGYAFLVAPMFFCMLNAVPASDDFAFGSRTLSQNLFVDAVKYSWWNWLYHSGRWLTFFFQKLINPLNTHAHLGRFYGIWMICVFMIGFFVIKYSLTVVLNSLFDKTKLNTNVVVFFIMTVLLSTYYYSEAYNWYIGATAYAIPLSLLMLSVAYAIRYEETHLTRYYVGLILAGLIPATNEFLDIPIGLLYVYVVFLVFPKTFEDKKQIINRCIPLILFIICGITVVFAPGNFVRQGGYDVQPNFMMATKQIIIDMLVRLKDIVAHHPFTLINWIVLVYLGIKAGTLRERNNIVITIIITFLSTFGAVFPYVYGRAFDTTYLDVRMQYIFDYMILIGVCIGCIRFGIFLATRFNVGCTRNVQIATRVVIVAVAVLMLGVRGGYSNIAQIGIIRNSGLIKESYIYWDNVIEEIENSNETDVVINRDNEPSWSPYFLFMGLIEEDVYDESLDTVYSSRVILPNVYYHKNSIKYTLNYK